jgi:hypothetical protein
MNNKFPNPHTSLCLVSSHNSLTLLLCLSYFRDGRKWKPLKNINYHIQHNLSTFFSSSFLLFNYLIVMETCYSLFAYLESLFSILPIPPTYIFIYGWSPSGIPFTQLFLD